MECRAQASAAKEMSTITWAGIPGGPAGRLLGRRRAHPAEPFAPSFSLSAIDAQRHGKTPPFDVHPSYAAAPLDREKAGRLAGGKVNFGRALALAARSFSGTEKRGKFSLRRLAADP